MRELVNNLPTQTIVGLSPTTDEAYAAFMKSIDSPAHTVDLENGTRGHWIGDSFAEHVLFHCHGGGYAVYATSAHFEGLWNIVQELRHGGKSLAVLLLSYGTTFVFLTPSRYRLTGVGIDVSSTARYPRQLQQASSLLSYLVQTKAVASSNIILTGDSAGGHLLLSLLSHIIHPHPEVPPITLPPETVFLGAALLSPWVTFDTESSDSIKRNRAKDVLHIPSLELWSARFTGTAPRDNYIDPLRAPPEWWVGLPIRDILIVSGADEIFVDDIDVFARKLSAVHPTVSHFSASGEAHIQLFTEFMIRESKSKQRDVLQKWIRDRI
ncbi:alpha/beta-hydrolase [Aspergillus steynii IBT 23096]|uniref:Alpha/beta-hydrolase n=1 Tax=Aspergillus steynii IBT 23096 TaxID=1392250 RepID=A0A2I2GJ25_9EURO|nr:alpha/beta-hydrolase [Aspergillus steynii IBT 23096]PLB52837.1 alpha/beta-hydrolase [Aspergillus steynii IBT 23096]